eukprot:2817819-Rhodomonas_salina.1
MTPQRALIRRSSSTASDADADANASGKHSALGCLHGEADSPLVSTKDAKKVPAQLTPSPQCAAETQQAPWTACAELFRSSSEQLLRFGSGARSWLSFSMKRAEQEQEEQEQEEQEQEEQERDATTWWWSKGDPTGSHKRCTYSLLLCALASAALMLGAGTGSLTSFVADLQHKEALYGNAFLGRTDGLQVVAAGSIGGPASGGGGRGETCQAAQSRVDKLQEARK